MAGIIHIGAWEGQEYIGSAHKLLLFEPQDRPFKQMMKNLADQPGVTLWNYAAGAEKGTATMYRVSPDHSSSMLQPASLRPDFQFDGEEAVHVVTIDDTIAHLKLAGHYDVLRLDAQGYELEALKGATATLAADIKRVEVELHDPNTYPGAATLEQLDEFLEANGFARVALNTGGDDLADAYYEKIETE
jgi:FkbM family methyltransferase